MRYIWRDFRSEFNWVKHGFMPVVSIVAMGWVLSGNIHPYPPAPLRWFIYATIGVILLAIAVAFWLERRLPDAMVRAGRLLGDVEIEEEAAFEGRESPRTATPATPSTRPVGCGAGGALLMAIIFERKDGIATITLRSSRGHERSRPRTYEEIGAAF